jgi:hypothetical protein
MSELPFIDVHSATLAVSPGAAFDALERIGPRIGTGGHRVGMRLLPGALKRRIERG